MEISQKLVGTLDSDRALVNSFLNGDSDAFDQLFLKYQDYVYNVCLGIVGNPDDAFDCAQETFVRVYRKAREFQGRAALSTWIYRVAVNVCLGQLRKNGCRRSEPLEGAQAAQLPANEPAAWEGLAREDDEQRVRAAMAELLPDYRLVLTLRYFQELSYEEIAGVLGWTLAQVKVKLHRARRAFAARFDHPPNGASKPEEPAHGTS